MSKRSSRKITKAARESMGRNIDPATILRASGQSYPNANYTISSLSGATWFGPMQPLAPIAQKPEQGAVGRAWDYPVGYNQRLRPRQELGVTFDQLRMLSDSLDVLRLVIEKRKDQVEAYEWDIIAKDGKGDSSDEKAQIKKARDFLLKPSTEHDWSTWLRASLEDVFVLDAWTIYPRLTRGGDLFSLDLVDGATITRKLDETGRTPVPPDVAYQQILKGVPAVDYTSDELVYIMRNPRTNRVYGFSQVEQIMMTVNIAIRKTLFQLQYYTEGNIPEAIAGLPDSWNLDQVKQFQVYWDTILEGNTAQRRHMKFVPFDPTKIKETKNPELKDMFDEWLARVVCFAFSIPPTPFVRETNRSTSEQMAVAAKEEGIVPLLTWLKRRVDYMLAKYLGCDKIQFRWKIDDELDPQTQAEIDREDVKIGIKTIDEVRESRGDDPLGIDEPLVFTLSGAVPLKETVERARADAINPPEPVAPGPAGSKQGAPQQSDAGGKGSGEGKGKSKPAKPAVANKVHAHTY